MSDGYLEISLAVPAEYADEAALRLRDLAPEGVVIEPPVVPLGPDEGVRFEPWRPALLRLYWPLDERLAERRRRLALLVAALPFAPETRERLVREEDWAESWKAFFRVEHIGRRLVIRPTWRDYTPREDELVIDLDPGMAFGTGQHATTRLCLAALENLVDANMDVLDLGCGSGVLALASARLGCRAVLALDIEPVAVATTRANAALNGLQGVIRAEQGSLDDSWPLPSPPLHVADLLVANINATVLVALAPALAAALRRGGRFLGSGIIEPRLDEVLLAFAAAGLRLDQISAEADWRAVIASQP